MENRISTDNRIKSNAEELYAYISNHKVSVLSVWIFAILVYGAWCAQNIVTFDAEGLYNPDDGSYVFWYQFGRWSLVLFMDIFNVTKINPYFQITLFGLLFPVSVVLWWFCFYRWNRNTGFKPGLVVFSGIYLTHPIWALQFSYRNQMEAIAFLMCLLPLALILVTDRSPKGRVCRIVISAVLAIICFGGYQSFMFMYGEGVILYLLFRLYYDYTDSKKKDFWKEVLFLTGFTAACFVANSVISRVMCSVNGIEYGTSYLEGQFHWGSYPLSENLRVIGEYLFNAMIANNVIYNCLGIIEVAAGVILICFAFRGRVRARILGLLLFIASWMTPFALLFVTASAPVQRSQFAFVLTIAFWGAVETGALSKALIKKNMTDAKVLVIAVILIAMIFPQMQNNTRLLYTEYMTMYTDEIQLWTIYYQALSKGANEGYPIVFVGGKANYVTGAMDEEEVIGYSYFEFNAIYSGQKIIEAMRAYGMNVSFPTEEQRAFANEVAGSMDSWPHEGGIVVRDGLIIVKM
ncbi:MAG: glucosyltransferase domain-containing protein [Clostridiales bacterium]|nr:glucosyltransferase domain-containing protein [Clostridiales bacterium]